MDLEETKKIIQNKITVDEAAREVRSHIKSYIDQKQNLREGFTETFKPLIETSEAVKTSKQLQDNQLALTEGLDKNRLAFDKMDEVKRRGLSQLPGYESTLGMIEEPEKEEEGEDIIEELEKKGEGKDIIEKIKTINARIKGKLDSMNKLVNLANKAKKEENFELAEYYLDRTKEEYDSIKEMEKERKRLQEIFYEEFEEESVKKTKITTVTYGKDEMDKFLNNKESIDLLKFYGLKLPSEYRKKSKEELQKAFEKGMNETANLKKSIKNVAKYKTDTLTG